MPSPSRKVAIFFTGGTIAMRQEQDGSVHPALHLTDLLRELRPEMLLKKEHACDFFTTSSSFESLQKMLLPIEWADLPSPHMTPKLMFALAKDVERVLLREDIAGAVVAHGTDVMEETAFMLDLAISSTKPVVITGAMRSFGEAGYDGLRNLVAAIRTCLCPLPSYIGTLLLMTDKLFAAREVTKTHSMAVDAFSSPGAGPVGTCVAGGVQVYRSPLPRQTKIPNEIIPEVELITLAPGMDGKFIACARKSGAQGIVVEGLGAGNVPPSALDEISLTLQAGLPVVLTSRCIEGGVWPVYGYQGGANQLQELGVILGKNLRGQKARILLMVALGLAKEKAPSLSQEDPLAWVELVRTIFSSYFRNELSQHKDMAG